ncbi:hypothetical protein TNCV_873711 [Trichonephila clavipes]|nr:hypothetical protein TNCV_873711 [Trichonephila clavipes]
MTPNLTRQEKRQLPIHKPNHSAAGSFEARVFLTVPQMIHDLESLNCKRIENSPPVAIDVAPRLARTTLQYKSTERTNEGGLKIMDNRSRFATEMNQTCFQYVEDWSETSITGNNSFQWYFLTSLQIKWAGIENCVELLSKEMPDIEIDDNGLFEEERRLNAYLTSNKLEQLENQHAEKLIKDGWKYFNPVSK